MRSRGAFGVDLWTRELPSIDVVQEKKKHGQGRLTNMEPRHLASARGAELDLVTKSL